MGDSEPAGVCVGSVVLVTTGVGDTGGLGLGHLCGNGQRNNGCDLILVNLDFALVLVQAGTQRAVGSLPWHPAENCFFDGLIHFSFSCDLILALEDGLRSARANPERLPFLFILQRCWMPWRSWVSSKPSGLMNICSPSSSPEMPA